jgi:predicted DNA-binding protein
MHMSVNKSNMSLNLGDTKNVAIKFERDASIDKMLQIEFARGRSERLKPTLNSCHSKQIQKTKKNDD